MPSAILALEDGTVFEGRSFGASAERAGEVVFNTALTGYQEIFTDPSYAGQIVVLTNPQIGNYGTNAADNEASRPYIEGLVTREFSPISSNWRSQQVTEEYLERFNVPVIAEIDTRAVVRHLRTHGSLRGVISSLETDPEKLVLKARGIRIAFLYLTYNPLPTNTFYVQNIAPFQSSIATTAQSCASTGLYFQVNTDGDISAALSQLFEKAIQSARPAPATMTISVGPA